MNRFSSFLVVVFLAAQAQAANLAIIDSGVDYKHKELSNKMWTNPASQTTVGSTTYKEDTHGWNFADKNNQIIDYKYLGTFSSDVYKMFEVQGKKLKGTATEQEIAWYNGKKADEKFVAELSKFGNFVHGTHVSGISSMDAANAKVIGMKLIPTAPPGSRVMRADNPLQGEMMLKMMLMMVAQNQGKMLTSVGKYAQAVKSEIANGSFGTSVAAVKPVVANLYKQMVGTDPTEAQLLENSKYLVEQVLASSKAFVTSSPETLFVFAAGNDGTNNDEQAVSPANIKEANVITVAASFDVTSLAVFSNYGANNVEVAAPGVLIKASIPGDEYLEMSGTSMAAPFVTNVAGLVKDANPSLKAADIKKILMDTVDVKDFLKGKVKTSGIVNRDRAVAAAKASVRSSLEDAIAEAKLTVADVAPSTELVGRSTDVIVTPLPSLF